MFIFFELLSSHAIPNSIYLTCNFCIFSPLDKSGILIMCLILSIVGALILFLIFIITNSYAKKRRKDGGEKGGSSGLSRSTSGYNRCDGPETIVDNLLDDLDPILMTPAADPIGKLSMGSSYHSFQEFNSRPPANGDIVAINCSNLSPLHTINYNHSLSRSSSRYNHHFSHQNHHNINEDKLDSHPKAMAGTLNSYF